MIIGIYGYKKSGKTTLIEKLMQNLSDYKIATVKNIHSDIFIDREGTDTYRMQNAGAKCVVGASENCTTFIFSEKLKLEEISKHLETFNDFELIILEGFKNEKKITKIAVGDIEEMENTMFRYDNNLEKIIDYIRKSVSIERIYNKLPKLDCGKCNENCLGMANMIYVGEKQLSDCVGIKKSLVLLKVNGEYVKVGKFVEDFIKNTIYGMVSSLKGVGEIEEVELNFVKGCN